MGKFQMKASPTGIKFDLISRNGKIIASSEVYLTAAACRTGIASVQRNAAIAALEDQTLSPCTPQKNPKFELYLDRAGEYRFRLKARNGAIIAISEGYHSWDACKNGIESVRRNAPIAEIQQVPHESEKNF